MCKRVCVHMCACMVVYTYVHKTAKSRLWSTSMCSYLCVYRSIICTRSCSHTRTSTHARTCTYRLCSCVCWAKRHRAQSAHCRSFPLLPPHTPRDRSSEDNPRASVRAQLRVTYLHRSLYRHMCSGVNVYVSMHVQGWIWVFRHVSYLDPCIHFDSAMKKEFDQYRAHST